MSLQITLLSGHVPQAHMREELVRVTTCQQNSRVSNLGGGVV